MVRYGSFLMVALAVAMVAAPASGALFEQNFDGVEDNTTLVDLGWKSSHWQSIIRVRNEQIDTATAATGWDRMYYPFDSAVTTGIIQLEVDLDGGSGNYDSSIGFTGKDGTNGTGDRAATVRPLGDGNICIVGTQVGGVNTNVCSTISGSAHAQLTIDLDTLDVSAVISPLDGQNGGADFPLTGMTLDNTNGLGITGMWLMGGNPGGNTGDFKADNIVVNMVIPEPATLGLMGLGGLLVAMRRRKA